MGLARALIRRDMLGVLDWLGQVEAPVVAPPLVPLRVVLDADVARQVLVTDADSYGRPWLVSNIMGEGLGRNLFTATGEEWSRRRRMVTPVFTRAHGDELARLMSATLADELDGWQLGPVADIQCPLTDLTLRVAARALLGVDTTRDDLGRRLRDHFEVVLGWLSHRFSHPAAPPAAVPTPRNRAFLRERDQLRAVVGELIARRRTSSDGPMDVLGLLLESGLSDDEIVQECVGWLFAGHETTASTLAWALYSLAVAPEIQARVAAEGDALSTAPTVSDVDGLDYTGRVVEETLRLYPAGVGIARSARRPTVLAGRRLRRRTIVLISVYSIQRDRRRWPRPEVFDPERFKTDHRAHLPFGLGARQCLGARFAAMEARLALAMISSRWDVNYDGAGPPRPAITPALRIDGGLPVDLRPRVAALSD